MFINAFSALGAFSLLSLLANAHALPKDLQTRAESFTRLGCFTDSADDRALYLAEFSDDASTVESCAAFCTKYNYFGVEYGRECYCSNAQAASSVAASDNECSLPCVGAPAETCGGNDRIEIYINNDYTPSVPVQIGGFVYTGCFVDSVDSRVLPDNPTSLDEQSAELCAANCAGFDYFGLEYGRECYCGNTVPPTSARETDCSFLCAGDKTEVCGAGDRLSVYNIAPVPSAEVGEFTYQGCYTDNPDDRVLVGKILFDDAMTLELCADACSGYAFFGVEFYTECYCSLTVSSTAVESPENECYAPCRGNITESCGAANRINVYSNATIADEPAKNLPTVGSFKYSSCWVDDTGNRALSSDTYTSYDSMTLESCAAFCASYAYFGVEFTRECYCGNTLQSGMVAPEDDCASVCVGNAKELCGGSYRLNVYTSSSVVPSNSTAAIRRRLQ